jgi:hypothetical protein
VSADSPIVAEVRKRRCEISEQYGDDLRKYYEHLLQVQSGVSSRLVDQLTVVQSARKPEATSPESQ